MPWSGGIFSRLYDWTDRRDAGNPTNVIDADTMDEEFVNFKEGLEALLLRSGDNAATGDISMGSNKLTSVGNATVGTDALNRTTGDARYLQISNDLSDVTAATARTNLGLGTLAQENTAPIAQGGTGATTESGARTNLGLGTAATANTGSGNGLDADELDGQHGSYYRNADNLNAGTVPDARLPSNATGERTVSTSSPSGGSNGDIWYQY